MRLHPVYQLSLNKVREFLREPEAVFWVFVFPVLLTLALGIAFRTKGPETIAIAVQREEGAERIAAALATAERLKVEVVDPARADELLRTGKIAIVIVPGPTVTYRFDPTRPESAAARLAADDALQRAAGRADVLATEDREVVEKGSRYIDFLVPGLLGMNLMGTGMWGIGFSIVGARMRHVLKRFAATPMKRSHYLVGQMVGRLIFLALEVVILVAFAHFAFDVPIRGSFVALAVVALLGAMTFAGIGLLVASRARTIEGVSGLMNAVMLPMWILSGTFFSTARFPDIMQPIVRALPLTAINHALRSVMIDGATLASVAGELGIAVLWGGAAFAAALRLFRWS